MNSDHCVLQDGLSSGHASDLDTEDAEAAPPSALTGPAPSHAPAPMPPHLSKRQVSVSRETYLHQLEQLNMRNSAAGTAQMQLEQLNMRNSAAGTAQMQLEQLNMRNTAAGTAPMQLEHLNTRNTSSGTAQMQLEQLNMRNSTAGTAQMQLEQLNLRNTAEHGAATNNGHGHAAALSSLLAMEPALSSRLPPPSPAPESAPAPPQQETVAAAIKDIRRALAVARGGDRAPVNVTPNLSMAGPPQLDPWLPRHQQQLQEPPCSAPLPPPPPAAPASSGPPSPACSTPPPPPPVELQEESEESECEEERVPTPDIMKREDEDLDTDQVGQGGMCFNGLNCNTVYIITGD